MKSLKLILVAGSLLVASIAPALHAQDGKMKGGDRMKMMSETLALTDAQKAQIKPILADEVAALKALKDDTATAEDAKRAKARDIRTAHAAKIRAVLTPEQQAKFDEMRPAGGSKKKKGE